MKKVILGLLASWTVTVLAGQPNDVRIDVTGTFDANRIFIGTFTASGAFDELGSVQDTPNFVGQAVHISRLMTTASGEFIVVEINTTHVAGLHVTPPDWCAPPPLPPGALLFYQTGSWKVAYGTGPYSLLQGNGKRATWLLFDSVSLAPIAATECLIGDAKDGP